MKPTNGIEFHQNLAERWESKYTRKSFRLRDSLVEKLLAKVDLVGKYWLDAGCGSGHFSRLLASKGAKVLGVDAASEMVRVSRELTGDGVLSGSADFRQIATIESMEIGDCTFDGVLCNSVLEYLDNPAAGLLELVRMLKPGGVLLVSVPNRQSFFRRFLKFLSAATGRFGHPKPGWIQFSKNEYSGREFQALLTGCGAITVDKHYFGGRLPQGLHSNRWLGPLIFFDARREASKLSIDDYH